MNTDTRYADVNGIRIAYERDGNGFPLLLLHGYPETRRMWRVVAGALTERFDVVNMDLRGYGESDRPDDPEGYDKRKMGEDALAVARSLGWERFLIAGHDRGGRASRRLAADHPEALVGASLLDILPMEYVFDQGRDGYARRYWHWYFFLQRGLPERLIKQDPTGFLTQLFHRRGEVLDPENVAHYIESFATPGSVEAILSDYRTAFEVDRPRWTEEVAAGHRIKVPLQILWGELGNINDEPALDLWRNVAEDVRGTVVPGSGHYIPEEQPEHVVRLLNEFADELGLP
ncbi:MAG: alpha/beta hydrolase [Chloroflexi bacterium]|nr:alpha/beta hydrolase [Chloroflexota bacterium]